MSSLLKIGELAKQTGLSIRTLHYYDEIGLLVPSHRTEADFTQLGYEFSSSWVADCRCGRFLNQRKVKVIATPSMRFLL